MRPRPTDPGRVTSSAAELQHQSQRALHAARPPRGLGAALLVRATPDLRAYLGGQAPRRAHHHVAADASADTNPGHVLGLIARARDLELRLPRPPLDARAEEDVALVAHGRHAVTADTDVPRALCVLECSGPCGSGPGLVLFTERADPGGQVERVLGAHHVPVLEPSAPLRVVICRSET